MSLTLRSPALTCRATGCSVPAGLLPLLRFLASLLKSLTWMKRKSCEPENQLGAHEIREICAQRNQSRRDGTICSPARECRVGKVNDTSPGGTAHLGSYGLREEDGSNTATPTRESAHP